MFQKILQSIIRKKARLKWKIFFSVNYRSINTNEIIDIHKYLINKIIKKMFIIVLFIIINASKMIVK